MTVANLRTDLNCRQKNSEVLILSSSQGDFMRFAMIPGLTGYRVGEDGSVWSCMVQMGLGIGWVVGTVWRELTQTKTPKGYHTVYIRGKSRRVNRLVLMSFIGPPPKGYQSCHNDGNKSNNSLGNLRWDTPQNNQFDRAEHGTSKLSKTKIVTIRAEYATGDFTQAELARKYNVHQSQISRAVSKPEGVLL